MPLTMLSSAKTARNSPASKFLSASMVGRRWCPLVQSTEYRLGKSSLGLSSMTWIARFTMLAMPSKDCVYSQTRSLPSPRWWKVLVPTLTRLATSSVMMLTTLSPSLGYSQYSPTITNNLETLRWRLTALFYLWKKISSGVTLSTQGMKFLSIMR